MPHKTVFNANGLTVADLKEYVKDLPEVDEFGEPCEVWFATSKTESSQARELWMLNYREDDNGKWWSDILIA